MKKTEAFQFLRSVYQDIVVNMDTAKIPDYFSERYIQVTDGVKTNREEFIHHIAALKDAVESISVSPFYDALFDDQLQTATLRYIVDITKKNGARGQVELIALMELDGRKIIRCNEISRPMQNPEEFQELASINRR